MPNVAGAAAMAVLAGLMGYGSYHYHDRQQQFADTEATTTDSLSEGQVKVRGEVEAIETVRSPVTGGDVVLVDWTLRGDPENEDEVQEVVVRGRRAADFELVDEHGSVRVEPMDATLLPAGENSIDSGWQTVDTDTIQAVEEEIEGDFGGSDREGVHVRASGALNTGPGAGDFQAEYAKQRFQHEAITVGEEVSVLGTAREEDGEFVIGDGDGEMVVSGQSEEDAMSNLGTRKLLLAGAAVVFALGAVFFLVAG